MNAVNPQRIFGTLVGYQATAALACAIRMDVFSAVGRGKGTVGELARDLGASERGMRALCCALVAHGFLELVDGRYRCAPDAAVFLDKASNGYIGSITRFLNDARLERHFDGLEEAVRRGGTADEKGGTTQAEAKVWEEFARAMEPLARVYAREVAEVLGKGRVVRDVLDLAAGHGVYGIEFGVRDAKAVVTFVDWAGVLEVAKGNAAKAGLGERARFVAGSVFEVGFGSGRDLVLMPNLLHHFAWEECVALLKKARGCLGDGGRVAVAEFLLEESRVAPFGAAVFDLVMLATTPQGQAWTRGEYLRMFEEAGLGKVDVVGIVDPAHAVFVAGGARGG